MGKEAKSIAFYLSMLLGFGLLMYFIIQAGQLHQEGESTILLENAPQTFGEGFKAFSVSIKGHVQSPLGLILLQIIVILVTCRLFSWFFTKLGQPSVIGEILAGIVLGPSILGYFFPEYLDFLFPSESLDNITLLSQFGLILFMFAIGMELDLKEIRATLKKTILISHSSTIVPFAFGMLLAYFIYGLYADPQTPFLSFALFIGIAMSITAFPVLARIIQEKGLTKTHLGTLSLASAANGDITAWCLLAVVVSIAQAGNMISASFNILFSIIYILFMFFGIRPFLRMIGNIYHNHEVIAKGMVALIFLLLIISVYFTEILGLHALFGAFITGIIMPSNLKFRKIMTEKVEDTALSLFLPLFFVSTGLRTQIGLLDNPGLWLMCGIFTIVAIAGKFGGTYFAARIIGETQKNSLYLGALMNTRGLMELIVLTIGYEMGILPPTVFVMLVLMTLVTTFMTTPLLSFISFLFKRQEKKKQERKKTASEAFRLLLPFGRAHNGQTMLNVAHQMFSEGEKQLDVTALHFTIGTDVSPLRLENFEEISFAPILSGAAKLGISIKPRYQVSNNAAQDIVSIANKENFDFLLVGAGIAMSNNPEDIEANKFRFSLYNRFLKKIKAPESWAPGSLLRDKTKQFIEQTDCTVAIFVNRDFTKTTNVLVIINHLDDLFLLDYIPTLLKNSARSVAFLIKTPTSHPDYQQVVIYIHEFIDKTPQTTILSDKHITPSLFNGYTFMLISYPTWDEVSETRKEALQYMPSSLIIQNKKF
ncbi:MAG: cation:proton antiporter [Massilibacteroides sp.]|nr:cation:proton antiporter [Massilibacteroides sp.]MDD3061663.1 cation:proton antiporter [Massilibacteroides sp.]MDD4114294.1 cation:proton antiporter [Massilibacteroides sp.]MDD4659953.1 cation:proton antiporter [Massilibacteroides sp.]